MFFLPKADVQLATPLQTLGFVADDDAAFSLSGDEKAELRSDLAVSSYVNNLVFSKLTNGRCQPLYWQVHVALPRGGPH